MSVGVKSMGEYNEEAEFDRYFNRNYAQLLQEDERELFRIMLLNQKFESSSSEIIKEQLRKQLAYAIHRLTRGESVEGIETLFEDLVDQHNRRLGPVIDEIRRKIAPARCPECKRIVRTPEAKQCLWCGADWHDGT